MTSSTGILADSSMKCIITAPHRTRTPGASWATQIDDLSCLEEFLKKRKEAFHHTVQSLVCVSLETKGKLGFLLFGVGHFLDPNHAREQITLTYQGRYVGLFNSGFHLQ